MGAVALRRVALRCGTWRCDTRRDAVRWIHAIGIFALRYGAMRYGSERGDATRSETTRHVALRYEAQRGSLLVAMGSLRSAAGRGAACRDGALRCAHHAFLIRFSRIARRLTRAASASAASFFSVSSPSRKLVVLTFAFADKSAPPV